MALPIKQLGALSTERPSERPLPKLKDDRAAYGVAGKGFFNDQDEFLYPGQATYYDGEPNMDLIPLNRKAYDNMQLFLDKLDSFGIRAAKQNGRTYIPIVRQAWVENEGYDELPAPESVMGVRKNPSKDIIR